MAATKSTRTAPAGPSHWTFLSNHAHVLICLSNNPQVLVRELAQLVGITERAVLAIIADLEEAGVVVRRRQGRVNRYRINPAPPLRHPVERHRTVRDLLAMVSGRAPFRRKLQNKKIQLSNKLQPRQTKAKSRLRRH